MSARCVYARYVILVVVLPLLIGCGKAAPATIPAGSITSPTETTAPPTALPSTPTATTMPTRTPVPTSQPTATLVASDVSWKVPGGVQITIVYDNMIYDAALKSEWGFSAWIEYDGHVLLFDTGGDGLTLLGNMEALGLDPQRIEMVVLSHIHGDHVGGLPDLLATGIKPTLYVPASFPASFQDDVSALTELVEVAGPTEILPGVHSTGGLGQIGEQALLIETTAGSVIVTGCAHPGVTQIVRKAKEIVPGEIALLVGGFHLLEKSQAALKQIAVDLKELGVQQISPTHCTGEEAIVLFADQYGEGYIQGGVGRTIEIGSAQPLAEPLPEEVWPGFLLENVGLDTPESVLYDPEADVYLVSNINGNPIVQDGNGFISRLSPAGELLALKWIDGQSEGVTLHAPKGTALAGNELFVADINVVRIFDRYTGAPSGEIVIDGAVFLNDVTTAGDGSVYVSDSSTGWIYRIAPDRAVASFAQLDGVNGLAAREAKILAVAGRSIYKLGDDGQQAAETDLPNAGLDGLIVLADGKMLISSWGASAVYIVESSGTVSELFGDLSAPADIGFDFERRYVLIPHFNDNQVEALPLP
ncbi:MAG: MBL fold metallo-hydrolase [Anaerolineae bacterium]|nr:MBL fold metallo-hydrolase [Anaerolineae bacterium]